MSGLTEPLGVPNGIWAITSTKLLSAAAAYMAAVYGVYGVVCPLTLFTGRRPEAPKKGVYFTNSRPRLEKSI